MALLREEIRKTRDLLEGIDGFYREFIETDLPALGRKRAAAVILADILGNFYTFDYDWEKPAYLEKNISRSNH